ncbi:MAG: right-handed parallel beta-helix repeat-containing protein, partial [bacterium]
MIKKIIIAGFLLSLFIVQDARCATVVSGAVSGNWTLAGSPYIIATDTITIATDTTLKIDPGVEVWFATNTPFSVYGTLTAIGTDSNRVIFKGSETYFWEGIRIIGEGASQTTLSYVEVRDARCGVYLENTSDVVITDSLIHDCQGTSAYGIWIGSSSNIFLGTNSVYNIQGTTATGIYLQNSGTNTLSTNTVSNIQGGTATGIYLYNSASNTLISNVVEKVKSTNGGTGTGILLELSGTNTLSSGKILQNDYGLYNDGSFGTITAFYVWWGHYTGPYHSVTNPQGKGNPVSDCVNYGSWSYSSGKQEIILLNPESGRVGESIEINGAGFATGTTILISFGTTQTMTTVTSSNNGTFSTTFNVNIQPEATVVVTAADPGGNSSTALFYIITPKISFLSPLSGVVGCVVTVEGQGFSNQGSVTISFGTRETIATTQAGQKGTFSVTFVIDTQSNGAKVITAKDSLYLATTSFSIQINVVIFTPTEGYVGDYITIFGTGFTYPANNIEIYFTNSSSIPQYSTFQEGTFSVTFMVETLCGGVQQQICIHDPSAFINKYFLIKAHIFEIDPKKGVCGSQVVVSGNGYGNSQEVRIDFGTSLTITTTIVGSNGVFMATFTVSTQTGGTKVITAQDGGVADTTLFVITENIYFLSPPLEGHVGSEITICGKGYTGTSAVSIDFGTYLTITTAPTSAEGTFSTTFLVSTQPYNIKVITVSGVQFSTTTFTIKPKIYLLSPLSGYVDDTVEVFGAGYSQYPGKINIYFATNPTPEAIGTATQDGTFSVAFTVPHKPAGQRTVKATDFVSGFSYDVQFVILGRITSISPSSGRCGSEVTVEGDGYGASEQIDISFGINPTITTGTSSGDGDFLITFIIDTQAYGTRIVTAKWATENDTTVFFIQTGIDLSPPEGALGDEIWVMGRGFYGTETVAIHFGTQETIATATSSLLGTFSVTFLVNTQTGGTTVVTAKGEVSDEATFVFYIKPKIALVWPQSGVIGSEVTIEGAGYKGTVTVTIGDIMYVTEKVSDGSISANGTFSATFILETQPSGTSVITAYDEVLNRFATSIFVYIPEITVFPDIGQAGDVITVTGGGFSWTGEVVAISFGTHQTITTATSSSKGTFSVTFVVDTQGFGTKVITGFGINSGWSATDIFLITSRITLLSPISGCVGDLVEVRGCGFSSNTEVSIHFGTDMTITTAIASASGTFSATFLVSTQPGGGQVITAETQDFSATTSFEIQPKIFSIFPSSGTVGSIITMEGVGFEISGTFDVDFGSDWGIAISNNATTQSGTFSITFLAQTQAYGTTVITARDSSLGATTIFLILSEIQLYPSAGTVSSPVTLTGTGFGITVVRIDFGTHQTITTAISSLLGTFSVTFLIDTQSGNVGKVITAQDVLIPLAFDTDVFGILPEIIFLSPDMAPVGGKVEIEGRGYEAYDTITIHFGTHETITTTITSASGTFSATFIVDTQSYSTKVITITTPYSLITTTFFITQPYLIGLYPTQGSVGTTVTIEGVGMRDEGTVTIHFGTHLTITSTIASKSGTFSATFIVDTQSYSTRVITITTPYSLITTTFFITQPYLILRQPDQGSIGTTVTIEGIGYEAYGTITIDFGTHYTITTAIAKASGTFSTTFIVSTQSYSTKVITITTPYSLITTTFFITGAYFTRVNPLNGSVGTTVTVEGVGYETQGTITIHFGTHETITSTIASASGTFSTTFIVSTQGSGELAITAESQYQLSTTTFTIGFASINLLFPEEGSVGTTVTITGIGYKKNGTITISFGSHLSITTTLSSASGTFSTTFMIDTQSYSTKVITANSLWEFATTTFFITPAYLILLHPTEGSVGTTVTIEGVGYEAGGTITIDFGTHETIATAIAKASGTFSATFIVDTQGYSTKVITITTPYSLITTTFFITQPYLILREPDKGSVGTTVTIEGVGMRDEGTVTIHFGTHLTI